MEDLRAMGTATGGPKPFSPKELMARLRVEKGDELYAVETPDGVRLTTYDPVFAAQMEVAERIMREDRELLRKLAQ